MNPEAPTHLSLDVLAALPAAASTICTFVLTLAFGALLLAGLSEVLRSR